MDSEALDWDLLLPTLEGGEHYDELFSNPIGMVTGETLFFSIGAINAM